MMLGLIPLVLTGSHVDAEEVRARQRGDVVQRATAEDTHDTVGATDEQVSGGGGQTAGARRLQTRTR